ncbi:PepSY-associated TM helix domain-containing protein [Rudaea sp.]|uniref:PepSY-associated TM helix domain-containing protein n=1 Tax=Rudaea sp. TaxID=2136325 RepID=UPI002ED3D87B
MIAGLRQAATFVHRWTGLAFGPLIVLMALTGIGLVLRPQLNPLVYPGLGNASACAAPLSMDRLADAARSVHPDGTLAFVWFYGSSGTSTMFRFSDNDSIYVDPCDGRVLGRQNRYGGLFGMLEKVHKWAYLQGDKPIDFVPGSIAIAMSFVLVIGGIFIWWPRKLGALKVAAKYNPRLRGLPRLRNQHTSAGLYAALILLPVALTGIPQAFDWAGNAICRIVGSPVPVGAPSSSEPAGREPLRVESTMQTVRKLLPDFDLAVIRYPAKPRGSIEIYTVDRTAPIANARNYLYLDAYSGEVLSFRPYAQASFGQKLIFAAVAVHTGQIGGLLGQCILLLGMLAVPILGYTGIVRYLRMRKILR